MWQNVLIAAVGFYQYIFHEYIVGIILSITYSKNYWIGLFHIITALQWRHNGRDNVSNHQPHDYLLNRLFRRRSKKTSKFRVTGLCAGKSPGTDEFPAQMASNADNVSICLGWRHQWYRPGCDLADGNWIYMNMVCLFIIVPDADENCHSGKSGHRSCNKDSGECHGSETWE